PDLMPEEAACPSLHLLDGEREQAYRHLLTRRDHHVLLALAGAPGEFARELEQPVGLPGHGGHDDDHVVAGLPRRDRLPRDVADAIGVSHGGAAILLNDEHLAEHIVDRARPGKGTADA